MRAFRFSGRMLMLGAVAAATALGPLAAPVEAFELFGVRLFGSDRNEEPPSPDARPYEVDFTITGEGENLLKRIRNASTLYGERDEVPSSTAALVARARGDYARILAALYAEGRYGGAIAITANGRPVEDIAPDAELTTPVQIAVDVAPGPQFLFGDVAIRDAPPPVLQRRNVPPTPAELGLEPGLPAKSTVVLESEAALVAGWRQHGHPKARIAERTAVARHPTSSLDVGITVSPGPYAVFGPVTATGTERMDPAFVAWYTGIRPGEPFDPDDIEQARRQLRRLEVFRGIRIVEADEVGPDGDLPITVDVTERPRHVFGVGATYSTLDGGGLEGYWQHRNLFGHAERLRFDARVARIQSAAPDDYNYLAAVTYTQPGVFTPFTDFTARVFADQDSPETYRAQRIGTRIALAHRFFEGLRGAIGAEFEASHIEDAPIGNGDFLLAGLPAELAWDGTDDDLNPTRGYRVTVRGEPYHEFRYDHTGLISELIASTYYSLDPEHRFVLAVQGALGSIVGVPVDEFPANRLFYAGGGGSIRGYAYRSVGPERADGEVIGGRSYFTGSIEARARVTEDFGIVPFLDFGNAFRSTFPDFSAPLQYGAGVGLRYYTSLGPLRFDVATPLNPRPDDPTVAFYIGLGQAF